MKITFSSAGLLQLMVLYLILSLPFLFVSALPAFADSNCPAVTSSALPDTSGTVTIQLTNNRSATDNGEVELAYLDTSVSTDNPTLEGNHLFFHAINGNSWLDGFDGVNLIAGTLTYTATLNNPNHLTSLDVNVSQFNGTWCTTTLTLTRSTSPTPTPTPTSTPTPTPTPGNNCPAITSSALPDTSGTVTIQTTNNRTDPVGETEFAFLDTSVSTDNPANDAPYDIFYHGINGSSWLDGFVDDTVHLLNSGATSTYTATLHNPNHVTSLDVNVSQFNGTWCTTTITLTRSTSPTPTPTPQNQPPSIHALSNATINEGNTYTANGSFTDPDSTSWTATVDYGDGSGAQPLTLSGTNFSLSHVYKDNGTSTVTVSVTDNQGATGTGTATVTVNNVAPTVGTITAAVNPVQVNTATTASANFTDPGGNDTHTASWNWGDGNTTTGTVTESNGSGSVSDSHTYTSAGVYQISLTVTDKDGGAGTQIFQYLSVYNPTSQGLFSAGQHFTSPAGAYAQNTSLTGMVRFGLSYKYQGTMPVGTRQFSMDFNTANFHFNATTINSLIITNGIGTLTGTGTVNGAGTYNFLVTGSESANTIRIQMKDQSGNVVYDTQPGASDTATPTTAVTGNVLAH